MAAGSDSSPDLHVIIIGTGITGLLLSQALKKNGIHFSTFEQDPLPTSRPREWTLAIHWSIPHLATMLPSSLYERLSSAHCDPFYTYDKPVEMVPLYNGATGELMKEIPGPGLERFSRARLRTLFAEGINIQYGKELVSLSYGEDGPGVTAHFKDGSTVHGDVVVGADGPQSMVREGLVGTEKAKRQFLPFWNSGVVVKYSDDDGTKARHVRNGCITSMAWSPDGTFSFISVQNVLDPDDPTTWTFQLNSSWPDDKPPGDDQASILAALKSRHEKLAEPFRSANLWIPEGTVAYSSLTQYWIPTPWDNRGGRTTLVGDAAHAMPAYRGQGLNHCIDDAAKLLQALKNVKEKSQLGQAIDAYEAEMIPRTKLETELSVQNAEMVHNWEKVMESPMMRVGIAKSS